MHHVVCPTLEPTRAELALIRDGLSRRARDRSWERSCEQILEAWEPLVRWLARRCAPAGSHVADFAQVGRMTLLRAALKFPPGYPGRFEHYARRALRNALIDEARRVQLQQREKSLDCERAARADTPLTSAIRLEGRAIVRQRLTGWTNRLRTLVELLFVNDLNQAEAARALGLTPARISQLCRELRLQGRAQLGDLADLVG
jgi:RNA polymerase sigma factor (sigma-70 family)